MDQYTRRIIGFGLHAGAVDGNALCQMFNHAIRGQRSIPKYLSSDNDPLYRFHQWQANLRILDVTEIKTVPYVPWSHPFVERLIGTIRRECLDRTLFWTTADLESKLLDFKTYFNLAQPDFLIPSLDQRSPFADWTVSPRCIPVNRGFSVSAIGYKIGFNINSPATGAAEVSARHRASFKPNRDSFARDARPFLGFDPHGRTGFCATFVLVFSLPLTWLTSLTCVICNLQIHKDCYEFDSHPRLHLFCERHPTQPRSNCRLKSRQGSAEADQQSIMRSRTTRKP